MSSTTDETKIVGEIGPEGRSMFRIVRREQTYELGANVRSCNHEGVVLDERFSTVTCSKCGERLQAFDILLRHAEWWEQMLHARDRADEAAERLQVAEMRRLVALKFVTDEERAKLNGAIRRSHTWGKDDNPRTRRVEFSNLIREVESAYQERKRARRGPRPQVMR